MNSNCRLRRRPLLEVFSALAVLLATACEPADSRATGETASSRSDGGELASPQPSRVVIGGGSGQAIEVSLDSGASARMLRFDAGSYLLPPPVRSRAQDSQVECARVDGSRDRRCVNFIREWYIASRPVTVGFVAQLTGQHEDFAEDPRPVKLTWWEATRVADALSVHSGLEPCYRGVDVVAEDVGVRRPEGLDSCSGFRLPTYEELWTAWGAVPLEDLATVTVDERTWCSLAPVRREANSTEPPRNGRGYYGTMAGESEWTTENMAGAYDVGFRDSGCQVPVVSTPGEPFITETSRISDRSAHSIGLLGVEPNSVTTGIAEFVFSNAHANTVRAQFRLVVSGDSLSGP